MLYLVGVIVLYVVLYCTYKEFKLFDEEMAIKKQAHDMRHIPILNTIETFRCRQFENERRGSNRSLSMPLNMINPFSCARCEEDFVLHDTVLDCHSGHVFHLRCFEDYALDPSYCPTCGKSMNMIGDAAPQETVNHNTYQPI